MKTLYLIRHAKSSWADPRVQDHDRPLNERGLRDAPAMALKFKERKEPIQRLISSTANRARTTAQHLAQAMGKSADAIELNKAIYLASMNGLFRVINDLPDDLESVALFGHNPGFTDLCEQLTHASIGNLPTCSMARIDFDLDNWEQVSTGTGMLVWFDHPKLHPELQ